MRLIHFLTAWSFILQFSFFLSPSSRGKGCNQIVTNSSINPRRLLSPNPVIWKFTTDVHRSSQPTWVALAAHPRSGIHSTWLSRKSAGLVTVIPIHDSPISLPGYHWLSRSILEQGSKTTFSFNSRFFNFTTPVPRSVRYNQLETTVSFEPRFYPILILGLR